MRRANAGSVDQRAHRDMHVGAVSHHREEKRAADTAPRVVRVVLPEDEQAVQAVGESSLSRSMPANALNAEPVAARQSEQ